jgi:maleylpyruvate isomerase
VRGASVLDMPDPALLALLEGGTRRSVRSVDAMDDDQWAAPSLLPGWSRAHVVAHLALNAEALTGALEGVREGRAVPMYPSQEDRDADIAELAAAPVAELRDRFLGSTTLVDEAVAELPDNLAPVSIERAATAADWEPAFSAFLLDRGALRHTGTPFTAHATDLGRTWTFGALGGPTVSGTGAALAWWGTGRGSGEGLTSDDGQVPGIEAW